MVATSILRVDIGRDDTPGMTDAHWAAYAAECAERVRGAYPWLAEVTVDLRPLALNKAILFRRNAEGAILDPSAPGGGMPADDTEDNVEQTALHLCQDVWDHGANWMNAGEDHA